MSQINIGNRIKLLQISIDNCKRTYSIDLVNEIDRLKNVLDIEHNKYPKFWESIEKLQEKKTGFKRVRCKRQSDETDEEYKERAKQVQNETFREDLHCPMNVLYEYKFKRTRSPLPTIPNKEFFVNYEMKENRRKCRKVEELIQKYAMDLYHYNSNAETDDEEYFILQDEFEELIEDIRQIHISNNYLGLMSYLINRALHITSMANATKNRSQSTLYKNQSLLMKTLYTISPQQFLQCFSGHINKG